MMENKQNNKQKSSKSKSKQQPETFMNKLTDYRLMLSNAKQVQRATTLLEKDKNLSHHHMNSHSVKFTNINADYNTSRQRERDGFTFSGLNYNSNSKSAEALEHKVVNRQKKHEQQIEKLQTEANIIEDHFQSKVNQKQQQLKQKFLQLEYLQKEITTKTKQITASNKVLQIQFPKQTQPRIYVAKQKHLLNIDIKLKNISLLNQYCQSIQVEVQTESKKRERQYPQVIQFLSENFLEIESLLSDLKTQSYSQLSGLEWKLQDLRLDSKQMLQSQSRDRKNSHNLAYTVLDKLIQRVGCLVSDKN